MRHIPEEELHAYLDQALSRTQCVEIERHLARCGSCKRHRDNIAGLRDRTTALLARIGPPSTLGPSFRELQARAAARQVQAAAPRRWLAPTAWAAGIAAAIVIGWQVKGEFASPVVTAPIAAAAPVVGEPAPVVTAPPTQPQAEAAIVPVHVAVSNPKPRPAPRESRQLIRATRPVGNAAPESSDFAHAIETDSFELLQAPSLQLALTGTTVSQSNVLPDDLVSQPVSADPGLEGLWRTITPGVDLDSERDDIALIPGLPVIQMRQQGPVTAVDQRLESSEMIRTVSGPAKQVASLVDEDDQSDTTRMTVAIRQGGRMVSVTGPRQAMSSLLSQVNMKQAKRRY